MKHNLPLFQELIVHLLFICHSCSGPLLTLLLADACYALSGKTPVCCSQRTRARVWYGMEG